ncbi:unnamed protein product, partial [Chrysoparadoxa australica]
LQSLRYPATLPEPSESLNSLGWRSVVCWLEDRKIRAWPVEQREPLRNKDPNAEAWDKGYESYLAFIECPFRPAVHGEASAMEWLLQKAIACEYEDRG